MILSIQPSAVYLTYPGVQKGIHFVRLFKTPLIAVLAGVSIAGVVGASAATLGGLSASSLGSDNSVIAACDTDGIAIAYTTAYNATGVPSVGRELHRRQRCVQRQGGIGFFAQRHDRVGHR